MAEAVLRIVGPGDVKKVTHPSDWNRLLADTKFVKEDGDVDLEGFSEVQVRHGPQVQQ